MPVILFSSVFTVLDALTLGLCLRKFTLKIFCILPWHQAFSVEGKLAAWCLGAAWSRALSLLRPGSGCGCQRGLEGRGRPVRCLGRSSPKVRRTECVIGGGQRGSHYLPGDSCSLTCELANGEENCAARYKFPIQGLMNILSPGFKPVTWKTRFLPNQSDRQSWFPVRKTMRCVKKLWFPRGKEWDVTQSKILLSNGPPRAFWMAAVKDAACDMWGSGMAVLLGQEGIDLFFIKMLIGEYLNICHSF